MPADEVPRRAPAAVHRAAAFICAHAGQPVTLKEIAAAARVSGRALQYGFRRHLGTTPTGYLRRVRLERAAQELRAADSASGLTVAQVARRWGFSSPSRFAAAYRQAYGTTPGSTLRRSAYETLPLAPGSLYAGRDQSC